ncbi:hypothetical protein [Spiroplasma endosymbiont of Dilophus febrilis]|uniref:hypothetical protein n=1 Tax=Spiroplasma endosymbiont of Dilophus febrilis TaxID=3066292 RepID=UPI00313EC409
MKIWVNLKDKNYHREFIHSINKKTGLEQRFWACRDTIHLIRTDLNGKKWVCVRTWIKKNSYDWDIRAYDLCTKKLEN